ncbi:MAG: hypothetical protein LAN84_14635 [Acidobacteriia bacterium]|nr:hypothetical protein [Terriglobia bacterium]
MRKTSYRRWFAALLLAVVFLATQFHFCADLASRPAASHLCPFCSVTGSAVAPSPLGIVVVQVTNRLETFAGLSPLFTVLPRAISPRAPPAL